MTKKPVFNSNDQVIAEICQLIVKLAQQCILTTGQFTIALSGGSTPKLLYQYAVSHNIFENIDVEKIHFYFSDERYVNQNDDRSNFKLANDKWFKHLNVSYNNVYPVKTSLENCCASAENYQQLIFSNIKNRINNIPIFDLIILGVGTDGHTASIFPESDLINESDRLVADCFHTASNTNRITFTFPLINAANHVFILALGKSKQEILNSIQISENNNEIIFPVQNVHPKGDLLWFYDNESKIN